MTANPANDNHALISLNAACELTSMSRTMIHRLRSEGRFPVAVELGEKRIAFSRAEVHSWIAAKLAARASARARHHFRAAWLRS